MQGKHRASGIHSLLNPLLSMEKSEITEILSIHAGTSPGIFPCERTDFLEPHGLTVKSVLSQRKSEQSAVTA